MPLLVTRNLVCVHRATAMTSINAAQSVSARGATFQKQHPPARVYAGTATRLSGGNGLRRNQSQLIQDAYSAAILRSMCVGSAANAMSGLGVAGNPLC
jgi:hypothetical protein